MDVKVFLKGIRDKRFELKILKDKRDEIYYSLMPSGIRYDLDKVQTSPVDRMPVAAGDLEEAQQRIDTLINSLSHDINLAMRVVNQMQESKHRQLIMLRYFGVDRKTTEWKYVADVMGYTEEYVRGELHGEAIKEARQIWKSLQNLT